jgi:hypothetical protein
MDRLDRTAQWLPGDGEDAVDIEQDAFKHGPGAARRRAWETDASITI